MRLGFFLGLLISLLPAGLLAEETDMPQDNESAQTTPMEKSQATLKSTETSLQSPSTPTTRPSEREFDPSEDISEDLSVPFPVDI
jgi:hypothetical protein